MNAQRFLRRAAAVAGFVTLQAATASAATNSGPPRIADATPWLAIAYLLVGAAAICVLGFKSSGRTHLD